VTCFVHGRAVDPDERAAASAGMRRSDEVRSIDPHGGILMRSNRRPQ
jgi:hypothetical protein